MGATLSPVGELLREWRAVHGLSQLDLALRSGVSSRHISFLETGRSQPSREMVLRLAGSLDLSLRGRNDLLVAAGYAPAYAESPLGDAAVAPVRRALETLLSRHEPYPAFVLDRAWNVLLGNRGHERLLRLLLPPGTRPADPLNVMRLVLDPGLLRPRIRNWELVAHVLGHRVRRQALDPGAGAPLRALCEELLDLPDVRDAMQRVQAPPESAVLIPLEIELGGGVLSWFSTIATIGTPQDVTLEELRLESLFPADEATAAAVGELL